mgnify:FL=1
MIIDTVHGANTAKIRNYRMDGNICYGKLAKVPVYRLRQVMNHLQLSGFLTVTNDEYAIVHLTESSGRILAGEETVMMKMAKEQEHTKTDTGSRKKKAKGVSAGMAEADMPYLSGSGSSAPRRQGRKRYRPILYFPIRLWLICAF